MSAPDFVETAARARRQLWDAFSAEYLVVKAAADRQSSLPAHFQAIVSSPLSHELQHSDTRSSAVLRAGTSHRPPCALHEACAEALAHVERQASQPGSLPCESVARHPQCPVQQRAQHRGGLLAVLLPQQLDQLLLHSTLVGVCL